MQSHLEVLGVRTSTREFCVDTIHPIANTINPLFGEGEQEAQAGAGNFPGLFLTLSRYEWSQDHSESFSEAGWMEEND